MKHLLAAALAIAASTATAQDLPCLSTEQTPRIMGQGSGPVQIWVHADGARFMFLIYSDGTEWCDGELM